MPKVQPLCRPVAACSLLNGRGWKALNCDDDTLTVASWALGLSEQRGYIPNTSVGLRGSEVTPPSYVSLTD